MVARELCKKFEQQKGHTARDSAFPAILGDDEDENSSPETKGVKRTESQQGGNDLKKPTTECYGCELKGHSL